VADSLEYVQDTEMNESQTLIRKAGLLDVPDLSRMGVELARLHSSFDAKRFAIREFTETDFEQFFAEQLGNPNAVLLVVEQDGRVVGYAFIRMEGESLEELRGRGAWLHDLFVEPQARRNTIGRDLVSASIDTARSLGSDSLMLAVSPKNEHARRLFEDFGLRTTMLEMRLELGDDLS
jgi:ribosomal protein S18 acetylase RimI-like enzyme